MSLFKKHPYLELGMGLVKENFAVVRCEEEKLWNERGFQKIRKYPLFGYKPDKQEVIMLGRPMTLAEFGTEQFLQAEVKDTCCYLGTYGMGGPGFFGLQLEGAFGCRWLVYCIWLAVEHILLDNRVLECHPDFEEKYQPWLNYETDSQEILNALLSGQRIEKIDLQEHALTIQLSGNHLLQTFQQSEKFPEQGGTRQKRMGYKEGRMSDYWLVIYDETNLTV